MEYKNDVDRVGLELRYCKYFPLNIEKAVQLPRKLHNIP